MEHFEIHTDGGCSPNPGVGGWAFVITNQENDVKRSGRDEVSTNNRMEYLAVIKALEYLGYERCSVRISTDSQLLINTVTKWMFSWEKKGWKKKNVEIKNLDLVKRLYELNSVHDLKFNWVKGHSGDKYNEMCDEMCSIEIHGEEFKNKDYCTKCMRPY